MTEDLAYGRKTIVFANGNATVKQVSITEKPLPDEDEDSFIQRLVTKYPGKTGTIQIVFKRNRPEYAILTFE